jgi:hypothetical protein
MNREYVFNIWAPPDAPCSAWVKPVLFAHIDPLGVIVEPRHFELADASWVPSADGATALVLDLPAWVGVTVGMLLARRGFRPVPVYNALPSPTNFLNQAAPVVCDVQSIVNAIASATPDLDKLNLPFTAPPAFLLDSLRRVGSGVRLAPGVFDNRSVSLPTDFPSGSRLASLGIRRVVLVQQEATTPQADLSHTLLRWQEAGIEIFAVALVEPVVVGPIKVSKPSMYRMLWQGLLATMGLRRNPLGGFGGTLPIPSSGSGG